MNNKKKILFVTNNLYGGGAEKVLETLVSHLNREKYEITIFTLHKCKIKEKTYEDVKIKYFYLTKGIIAKIHNKIFIYLYEKHPQLFYRYFIREKYNVEIAFIEGYSTKIVASSSNEKSKKIAWVHVDLINTPWTEVAYQNFLEEQTSYKAFDKIFCVSDDVKNAFIKKYKLYSNVEVQYNPIDENKIINLSNEKMEIEKNPGYQFITIGRLEEQKGYIRLLNVINRLKQNNYHFNLWILGYGSQYDILNNYIKDNGLEEYVVLLGYQENPYVYLKRSDAFICSSYSEGFSTVVTEALILGKPVFTVDCAGMRELFKDEKCGLIVENNDESLYQLFLNILSEKIDINYFAKGAKKRGQSFLLKKRISEIEGLIDE